MVTKHNFIIKSQVHTFGCLPQISKRGSPLALYTRTNSVFLGSKACQSPLAISVLANDQLANDQLAEITAKNNNKNSETQDVHR